MTDIITINDVRKTGYCTAGARRLFERHGVDFKAFVRDGMSETQALSYGDSMVDRVIAKAREMRRG